MDWSIFTPTLIATFAGVILSIGLSLLVRSLVNSRRDKRQRAITKRILSLEVANSLETLRSFRTQANKVLEGKGHIQTLCSPASIVHTPACNAAFQSGDIHRLGDNNLEEAVMHYAWSCDKFNIEMGWIREIVKEKFGFELVPLDIAQAHVQPRLAVVDELINRGHEVLRMMNEDLEETDTTSERSSD